MKGPYVVTWVNDVRTPAERVVMHHRTPDGGIAYTRFGSVETAMAGFERYWLACPESRPDSTLRVMPLAQWLIEQGEI